MTWGSFALLEEFYGPSFAIFKNEQPQPLPAILKSHPLKKESILRHMKEVRPISPPQAILIKKCFCVLESPSL